MNQLRNTLDNARNWWEDLDFSPLQRKSLLVLALIIVASSGFLVLRGTSEEIVQVAPPQIEMPTVTTHLMVDVAGAVLKPGVYALPMNARVIDAITAAGNVLKGADVSDINPVTVDVLWPQGQWADEQMSDPNNSSIAIVLRAPDFSLFAGGDMEPESQSQISGIVGHVDIYKVCHHGSRFQDESFTRALSPTISIISVGAGNTYGHPAPETIQSLTRLGSRVLRTDLDGAIAIRANRQRFRIRTSKGSFALLRWS